MLGGGGLLGGGGGGGLLGGGQQRAQTMGALGGMQQQGSGGLLGSGGGGLLGGQQQQRNNTMGALGGGAAGGGGLLGGVSNGGMMGQMGAQSGGLLGGGAQTGGLLGGGMQQQQGGGLLGGGMQQQQQGGGLLGGGMQQQQSGGLLGGGGMGQQMGGAVGGSNNQDGILQLPQTADTVQSFSWHANSSFLAVGGWDSHVHMAQIQTDQTRTAGAIKGSYKYGAPVMDTAWHSQANRVFVVGAAKTIQLWDVQTNQAQAVGAHEGVIRNCRFIDDKGILVTSGWDGSIKMWDLRSQQPTAVITRQTLVDRVHAMDVAFPYMVASTGDKKVHMFNLAQNPTTPFRSIPSPLTLQTRALSCMKHPGDVGYVIGSAEGRCAVRFCDPNMDASKKKFSFKCHRTDQNGNSTGEGKVVYPVNALDWYTNQQFSGCFATAGGDGSWSVWDKNKMSRPHEHSKLGLPVTAVKWSPAGTVLAYALGNDWARGAASAQTSTPVQVRLHRVTNNTLVASK